MLELVCGAHRSDFYMLCVETCFVMLMKLAQLTVTELAGNGKRYFVGSQYVGNGLDILAALWLHFGSLACRSHDFLVC